MAEPRGRRERAELAYTLIQSKASANTFIQGLTGVGGFPFTLAADVGTIPVIYVRMWNEIRMLYGQSELTASALVGLLKPLLPEVLADLVLDKFLGNIPIAGIYFNAICAKAMTWRLGTLFAFLASRGEEIPETCVVRALTLIRQLFPQEDMFRFATPGLGKFLELVASVDGVSTAEFDARVGRALDALKG